MRGNGINYDTGFFPGGEDSRPGFDPETARRELRIIAEQLHCTAVRISGGDSQRLETAARYAAEAGLEVWFAPFPCEQTRAELLPFFADCAQRAERIRLDGAEVVLVTGCEMTLFNHGFLDSAFWFTFVSGHAVHRPDGDPRDDTDMASYGVVKVLADGARGTAFPELGWEPKEVFHALAAAYGATAAA